MLLIRWAPDNIARTNFLFWGAFALHPPTPGRDDQGLPERMCVPCCPRTGLERDTDSENARGIGCLEQRINTYRAGKYSSGPLPEGCEPLLLTSILYFLSLMVIVILLAFAFWLLRICFTGHIAGETWHRPPDLNRWRQCDEVGTHPDVTLEVVGRRDPVKQILTNIVVICESVLGLMLVKVIEA